MLFKRKISLLVLGGLFTVCSAQTSKSNTITKSYGSLTYSYPKGWTELDFIQIDKRLSYGVAFFGSGEYAGFTIMEVPNDTGKTNAYQFTDAEMSTIAENVISPKSKTILVTNKTLDGLKSKTSIVEFSDNRGDLMFVNSVILHKGLMIFVQGAFTQSKKEKYLPLFGQIFNSVRIKR